MQDCNKAINHVREVLDTAVDASLLLDKSSNHQSEDLAKILLSVKLLFVTLIHFHNALYPERQISCQNRRLVAAISTSKPPSAACQLIMGRMRQKDWCRQSMRRACTSYDFPTALYLAELPRRRGMNHSRCSDTECIASNIDESTYQPAHVSASCKCQCISVDVDQLVEIIEEGEVPLVRVKTSDSGDVEIERRRYRDRHPFTVLSHVWSDGVENRETNSLPACKLRQLQSSVQLC